MKTMFKPLGLAAAVAAVSAGYAGVANAQTTQSIGQLGDLGIIPYYTVQGNWVTGVHIINSSDLTQVVKLRLRRGSDSADALDFNLIMSPKDEWTGFIDDSSGDIVFATDDNTCTAPIRADGRFPMPFIFREGAEEGYIEVIGMGSIDVDSPIGEASEHVDGVPRDCEAVASNFFAGTVPSAKGVQTNAITHQSVADTEDWEDRLQPGAVCIPDVSQGGKGVCQNLYEPALSALKVSYFFRDATAGTEMGNNAVHLAGFNTTGEAWMTNQETGLFSGDVYGFDFPDLDGGPWIVGEAPVPPLGGALALRGLYNNLRDPAVLGVASVLNDWSVASARNVSTDWVVTLPGQYTMIDYTTWADAAGLNFDNCATLDDPNTGGDDSIAACDFRDIPVEAKITLYDREEGVEEPEDGNLVISPAPPGTVNTIEFPYEVNVVQWTDGSTDPVLPSDYATTVDPSVLGEFGWAALSVSSTTDWTKVVCQVHGGTTEWTNPGILAPNSAQAPLCVSATGSVPMVGFVAWQRSFPSNPDANYGRLVEHSFTSSASTP